MNYLLGVLSQPLIQYSLLIGLPMLGAVGNGLFFRRQANKGARFATWLIWLGWGGAVAGLIGTAMNSAEEPVAGLRGDALSWVMATLILFVSGIVHQFSIRYLAGDRNYHLYFILLSGITSSALLMVLADHLGLLLAGWGISNLLLVRLMIHKTGWRAAYQSGLLALQVLFVGFFFLAIAFGILTTTFGTTSIQALLHTDLSTVDPNALISALLIITLAAMTQSALLPFHRWLTSSLNSPTPVSALMHAGLVNGGGFLLVRFAPLFLAQHGLLYVLFTVGVITAVVGTCWKLIQPDVKRMLACSTMGQMGFMVMQCGLGLFPAAVAHLCWHGLFKAFLFLSAGAVLQEKRRPIEERTSSLTVFLLACLGGLSGAYGFALVSEKPFLAGNTTAVLIGFAFIATTQVAQTILASGRLGSRLIPAVGLAFVSGCLYGASVHLIETLLQPLGISGPQPLNSLHLTALGLMGLIWLSMNLKPLAALQATRFWAYLYVLALNGSQPDPATTTPTRTTYQF
ncbi:proton-conducting transporter transmembrane domain-containing protein [Fibrisoma limi]|nr:proton-conducting transporter membrane subunit [Fibrisoma limi]